MLYRVSLTGKHDRFSVPQLGYLGYLVQIQRVFTGSDAEAVEALVCKTSLSGFESRRHLHILLVFQMISVAATTARLDDLCHLMGLEV